MPSQSNDFPYVASARASASSPLPLETVDLASEASGDLQAFVVTATVHAVTASPAGARVDRHKLTRLVESNLERLLVGGQLNFTPVLKALLRVRGVTENDLYIASLNLSEQLRHREIQMTEPDFTLDQWTRAQLLEEAHAATELARRTHRAQRARSAVRDLSRRRLGDLLVEQNLITNAELNEALEAQELTGNRLGTNLIQLGYLSEHDLADFLGQQLGLPFLPDIEEVPPEALSLVPAELATAHQVIPIAVDGKCLTVAMADPTNLRILDELTFHTQCRIHPVVAPELSITYSLDRYYGVHQEARFFLRDQASTAAAAPLAPLTEVCLEEGSPASAGAPAAPKQGELEKLAHDLLKAERTKHVFKAIVVHLRRSFRIAGVFELERGMVRGWSRVGASVSTEAFRAAELPVRIHPIIEEAVRTAKIYRGPGSPEVGHQWLTDTLGLPSSAYVHLIPIVDHRRKVVALVVANEARSSTFDERVASVELQAMATAALTMVAMRKRLKAVGGVGTSSDGRG